MATVGDEQSAFDGDSSGLKSAQFLEEGEWIEDDSAADNARDTLVEYTGRNEVQDVTLASKIDSVSCVVSALIPCDTIKSIRQDIDDFSFSFIAPLKADDGDIFFHDNDGSILRTCRSESSGSANALPPATKSVG